jgi:hypothetical protein
MDKQTFTMKSKMERLLTICSEQFLVQYIDQKMCEGQNITIQEMLCKFPHTHLNILSQAILSQAFCNMGSKNGQRCASNEENGFSSDFFEQYHKNYNTSFSTIT